MFFLNFSGSENNWHIIIAPYLFCVKFSALEREIPVSQSYYRDRNVDLAVATSLICSLPYINDGFSEVRC